jgi:ERCC4-type nuclease
MNMGESYVELMWRVILNQHLMAGFRDLQDAQEYAVRIGGKVIVIDHRELGNPVPRALQPVEGPGSPNE